MDFDFLAARGLTGARMAGGLEGDLSGDKERIRALRRGVDGGLATMLSCQSRHQTDVHVLLRVQRCALNISSSSGFRNEDMKTWYCSMLHLYLSAYSADHALGTNTM